MVLSDRTIRAEIEAGRIVIDPYDETLVQPSSVDVRVDRRFRVFHNARYPYIDVRQPMDDLTELVEVERRASRSSCTRASSCSARRSSGSTLPDDLVARLEGKSSSLGRLGLLIHSTAGFVDSGFAGNLTLELSNVANLPITIYHGHADRPDLVHAHGRAGRAPLRLARQGLASTRARPSRPRAASTSTSSD